MKEKLLKILSVLIPIAIIVLNKVYIFDLDKALVLSTFIIALVLWINLGIGWPSLYVIFSLMMIKSLGAPMVLSSAFGNATFVFLMFTFILSYSLSQTNLIKRIALFFVNLPFAKKDIKNLYISFLLSSLLLGLVMSPTVLFFILYPILEEIFDVIGLEKDNKLSEAFVVSLVLVTSLSSGMTPIAHVFPVLAMNVYTSFTDKVIGFAQYIQFALPLGILVFLGIIVIFSFIYRHEFKTFKLNKEIDLSISKYDKKEKIVSLVFIIVLMMWILPDLLGFKSFNIALPPIMGSLVLAMIKFDDKEILNLNDAFVKGVSWPSLLMTAAALALGAALTNDNIGLVGSLVRFAPHNLPDIVLVLVFIVWASVQSNLSSHMVTAQLVSSIAIPIFLTKASLNPMAIAAMIGFLASLGSATPPSMPYVAVVSSSEYTSPKRVMRLGFMVMVMVIILAMISYYPASKYIFN